MEYSDFSNRQIKVDELPKIEKLNFEPLSYKYSKSQRWVIITITVSLLCILALIQLQSLLPLTLQLSRIIYIASVFLSVIGSILVLYFTFANPKKMYAIREQDISYTSGLVYRALITQPFSRVQHIEIQRGPVQRRIGLANLQIFSAGGSAHTFEIPGLSIETAKSIRQYILDHKGVGSTIHG